MGHPRPIVGASLEPLSKRMLTGDFDGTAEALYKFAGFATSQQPPLLSLVERLIGDGAVRTVPAEALRSDGALARIGTGWRIYLRADVPPIRKRFVLLHELSHWALGPEASEEVCDRLAGALLLPRCAFLRELERRRTCCLAGCFGTSESCAWLRYGEATGNPLALVTPTSIRLRGATYLWPAESIMRELAGSRRAPGIRKLRLGDDATRAVLRSKFPA